MSWETVLKRSGSELTGKEKEAYDLLLEYGEMTVYPSVYNKGHSHDNLNRKFSRLESAFRELRNKGLVNYELMWDDYTDEEVGYYASSSNHNAFTVSLKDRNLREKTQRNHPNMSSIVSDFLNTR